MGQYNVKRFPETESVPGPTAWKPSQQPKQPLTDLEFTSPGPIYDKVGIRVGESGPKWGMKTTETRGKMEYLASRPKIDNPGAGTYTPRRDFLSTSPRSRGALANLSGREAKSTAPKIDDAHLGSPGPIYSLPPAKVAGGRILPGDHKIRPDHHQSVPGFFASDVDICESYTRTSFVCHPFSPGAYDKNNRSPKSQTGGKFGKEKRKANISKMNHDDPGYTLGHLHLCFIPIPFLTIAQVTMTSGKATRLATGIAHELNSLLHLALAELPPSTSAM